MPELPEVETTRRGIAPIAGQTVTAVIVRNARLRWPVPAGLQRSLPGRRLRAIDRRAKYLLLRFDHGTLIMHLGMSGSLRIVPAATPAGVHDHFDLVMGKIALRLRDPRRFGAVLWSAAPEQHALLRDLGPEPLESGFDGGTLYTASRGRRVAVKQFIMDNRIVVGVGNIYANESLFRAGIHPHRSAGRISQARYTQLAACIKETLRDALRAGGSTLRDFVHTDGSEGYFQLDYFVYGRDGLACRRCKSPIRVSRAGQRSTFHCPHCQS